MHSIDEKRKFLTEILDIIRNYSDSIEQDTYLKEVSVISETPLKLIYELFQKNISGKKKQEHEELPSLSPEDMLMGYMYENRKF